MLALSKPSEIQLPAGIRQFQDLTSTWENRQPLLMVISGPLVGTVFLIDRQHTVIGRDENCDIDLREGQISRRHLELERDPQKHVKVTDLGSTNGTCVNGTPIKRRLLRDGDKLQVGDATILKFTYQDSFEEAFEFQEYERAIRDPLTGVFNRMHFLSRLREEFAHAARTRELFSIILFRVDQVKRARETRAQGAADMLLRRVAEVVSRKLRGEDLFARYTDDCFAALLRGQEERVAYLSAMRIRAAIAETELAWESQPIPVTLSPGVASLDSNHFDDALEMLDEALANLATARRHRDDG